MRGRMQGRRYWFSRSLRSIGGREGGRLASETMSQEPQVNGQYFHGAWGLAFRGPNNLIRDGLVGCGREMRPPRHRYGLDCPREMVFRDT